jgi:hypothetical protein
MILYGTRVLVLVHVVGCTRASFIFLLVSLNEKEDSANTMSSVLEAMGMVCLFPAGPSCWTHRFLVVTVLCDDAGCVPWFVRRNVCMTIGLCTTFRETSRVLEGRQIREELACVRYQAKVRSDHDVSQ